MTAGVIATQDGYAYRVTDNDRLWLARMISPGAEGGDNTATLWTLASHHAMNHGSSLTDTARSYSQPISALWSRGGSKCSPGGSGYGTPACSEAKLANRERIAALQSGDLGPELALIDRWLSGQVLNPAPRATEWADAGVSTTCLLGTHGDCKRLILTSGNWYMSSHESDGWPANYVTVGGAGDAPSSGWMGPIVGVGVALAVGVVAWVASEEYGR